MRQRHRSCRTTDSRHNFPLYPNLIKDLLIERPNQVWVSDITYIRTGDSFCYLFLVTDAYTHQIIGYCVAPTLEARYAIEALKQAMENVDTEQMKGLIHHSDRGCQYASYAYTDILKEASIRISMTENGDPKENAIAERINGILKVEFLNQHSFTDINQVKEEVDKAVDYYNNRRPHRSLDMMTPAQAAMKTGIIHKRWKSHKDKYRLPCKE